jgi:hypothetical protein
VEKSDDRTQVLKLASPSIRVDVDQERSKGSALERLRKWRVNATESRTMLLLTLVAVFESVLLAI